MEEGKEEWARRWRSDGAWRADEDQGPRGSTVAPSHWAWSQGSQSSGLSCRE